MLWVIYYAYLTITIFGFIAGIVFGYICDIFGYSR